MSKGIVLAVIAGLGVAVASIVLFSILLKPDASEPKSSLESDTTLPIAKVVDNATENTTENMTQITVVRISGATTPTVVSRQTISEHPLLDQLVRGTDQKYTAYAEMCQEDKNCEYETFYYETKQSANITISDAMILLHTPELGLSKPCFDNGACIPDYFSNMKVGDAFYQVSISDRDDRLFDEIQRQYNHHLSNSATPAL